MTAAFVVPIFAVSAMLAAPLVGVGVVKSWDQRARDRQRRSYKLAFPSDLDAERVSAWLRSISGTLRSGPHSFVGVPTVVFELWATNEGMTHRLKIPWQHADYVIMQLRSLVPGIRVNPEDEWPERDWTRAVEVGLTSSGRQLRIFSTADVSASLLASVQALDSREAMLMQWVVTPAVPAHLPVHKVAQSDRVDVRALWEGNLATKDEVNDRRAKLSEPNVLAVLRVAAKAETEARADHLIYRVKAALAATRGPATRFVKRPMRSAKLQDRIDRAAGVSHFPIQLAVPELAALIAWPIGNPFVTGLPQALSRHLPAPESVPRLGRVLGRSNFPGAERPVALAYEEALKHLHIAGPTGVGKSALLANLIRQDARNGYGVVLIENKGDLFHAALDYVPPHRLNDVIVLDVNDTKRPVGFNVLNQGDPRVVIDELTQLFQHLYPDAKGVWTREVLYHGLRTLAIDPKLTFTDLGPLLVPMSTDELAWRGGLIRSLRDQELRNFWQRLDNQPRSAQDRITQPVMDRIWQINARPEIRNIIGQSTSSFQMADVVLGNKILLVNLSGLPRETAALTGTLLMNALWHAIKTNRPARPNFLYLDEFQDFMNLPVDPEDMLAKARGFGLGMTLAHQHLAQLPTEMRQAVLSNARSKLMFQTSSDDARTMAREFGHTVTDADFQHLGRYEALARVSTAIGMSAPLTLATNEPAPGYRIANQVRAASRQTYGRPVHEVERQIADRRSKATAPSRPRPKISGEGWGR